MTLPGSWVWVPLGCGCRSKTWLPTPWPPTHTRVWPGKGSVAEFLSYLTVQYILWYGIKPCPKLLLLYIWDTSNIMDFMKLSSSKWQTKLSKKAQASIASNGQLATKRKNSNSNTSPAPPKKGRLAHLQHMPSNNPHPLTTSRSRYLVVLLTPSLGLAGDVRIVTPPASDPSDHNAMQLMGGEDDSSPGSAAIVVRDSDDEGWVDEAKSPDEELGLLATYWDLATHWQLDSTVE